MLTNVVFFVCIKMVIYKFLYVLGCGLAFSWSQTPLLVLDDPYLQGNPLAQLVGYDPNNTEPQVNLATFSSYKPADFVVCSECNEIIKGFRFDCINCTTHPSICFACVGKQLGDSSAAHARHKFDIVSPARRPVPRFNFTRCEVTNTGEFSAYGLATAFSSDLLSFPCHYVVWDQHATAVRVDVYPDGRIVYADDYGRAGIVIPYI